jgi:hypothetical protein
MARVDTRKFGPEDHILYQVVQFINIQYKHVLYCHVPNERKAKVQYYVKLKSLGVKSGVPDLLIFNPFGKFIGLAIELKSEKGKVSELQSFWLDALKIRGWSTHVCYSFEETKLVLDEYFRE